MSQERFAGSDLPQFSYGWQSVILLCDIM